MSNKTITQQLVTYLIDAYSIEEQALQQLKTAPDIVGDAELSDVFVRHYGETEQHRDYVGQRLEAHGETPSSLKNLVMRAGGIGFVMFAQAQIDTPGKLVAHALSYEGLEWATYELLLRVAERADDPDTVEAVKTIRDNERDMMDRLSGLFDRAVEASLSVGSEDITKRVGRYLADAHALEAQAIQLLQKGPEIAGTGRLAEVYSEHLDESRDHQRLVEERLDAYDRSPSALKDAGMRLGALNWGAFFQAQPDTPAKLGAFAYAFEHLEIAGYELLRRVAARAEDPDTIAVAERILQQEHGAARKIAGSFDGAIEATLSALGVRN